ncbi:MAG: aminoacyl-tRNA hydrolase [Candidatus Sumerlaeia bacterium]|nr:aminoacyl-tRNA hydrolase [Candidatus Sumerlaeia bacterium]
MWLVVGLGNPGTRYERTPHNFGFDVVDLFARRHGLRWHEERRFQCAATHRGEGEDRVYLAKPATFMNLSGESAGPFSRYYKIPPERVLAISDDVALPMGRLRVREGGSSGGHNGLNNLIQHLGTQDFPRLRLGIEPTGVQKIPLREFVLMKTHGAYAEDAAYMTEIACDCLEAILRDGVAKAAGKYNGFDARKAAEGAD